MSQNNLVVIGGPRAPFNANELQAMRQYIEAGGSVLVAMAEGGENKLETNINALLEQFGVFVNTDSVIRKAFHKYLHPKEAFVGNGCLNKELVRVAKGQAKAEAQKQGKYAKRYKDTKDELADRDENGGLKFVYPYGATLTVRKPSVPILSSGPISFPPNRPIASFYKSQQGGRLFVIGSMRFFSDEFFENEDNQIIQEGVFKWLLNVDRDAEFERHVNEEAEISEYNHVPDITALADRLRSCLQESDEMPKDFTTLFSPTLFKFDTDLIPEAIDLYKTLNVKHEPLTLIPPQFETPLPELQAAVFLPTMKDLPPPGLDLFDLDEQFASERSRLAQLTNKCTDDDIEYFVKECGDIMGLSQFVSHPDDPKAILHYIFQEIVKYKSSNLS